MNYKKIIQNNFENVDESEELYSFYSDLTEKIASLDNDEIRNYLMLYLKRLKKKKTDYAEDGRDTRNLTLAILETENLLDVKSSIETTNTIERKALVHHDDDIYSIIEQEINERKQVEKMNIYQIFAIIVAVLLLIGGISLSAEVEEDGFVVFLTYAIYSFICFLSFYGFGEIIRSCKKRDYLLEKILKKITK